MAAVEKIEGRRKPDDFFGHRDRTLCNASVKSYNPKNRSEKVTVSPQGEIVTNLRSGHAAVFSHTHHGVAFTLYYI